MIERFVSLLYHDVHRDPEFDYGPIGTSATRYHISLERFQRHLTLIEELGLEPVHPTNLSTVVGDADVRRTGTGGRGVLISFDDGWRGAATVAAEALERRGWPAFFFVTTGFIGRTLFADAEVLRRLAPSRFAIGSHGVSHRMLSSLSSAAIREELNTSKHSLEDLLGRPVDLLSAPGGATDARVAAIAREVGYRAMFTSSVAVNPTPGGLFDIARLGVTQRTDDACVRRWLGFRLGRERFRKALLAIPKRALGMRAYSRLRRVLMGEGRGHEHVFEP